MNKLKKKKMKKISIFLTLFAVFFHLYIIEELKQGTVSVRRKHHDRESIFYGAGVRYQGV